MPRGLLAVLVLGAAACSPGGGAAPRYDLTPVLLVHGSGLSSRSWSGFVDHLVAGGYPREYVAAVDIVPPDLSNVRAAEDVIAPAAAALLAAAATAARAAGAVEPAPGRIDLVGHSMGAFSSRWYAARVAPERVRTWIGLAGANHGSDALAGLPGDGNAEMVPAFARDATANPVQLELNGAPGAPVDESPYGLGRDTLEGVRSVPPDATRRILYLTVRLDPDRWIQPPASALLDGCGGDHVPAADASLVATSPGNFHLVPTGLEHDHVMDVPSVRTFLTAVLRRGGD